MANLYRRNTLVDNKLYKKAVDKVFNCFITSNTLNQLETSKRVMFNFFNTWKPDVEVKITMNEHYEGRKKYLSKK
jgi:tRNA U34 5-methylaminomethyl-2-thiouridine-forming methyltransferase MnmC